MNYSEFQNMINTLNISREEISTEDLNVSQELFEGTVDITFPITHNISKFNGRYKTLNKFIDAIAYDNMENSELIPGPMGDQNSISAKSIKITEQLVKKAGIGIKNLSKSAMNSMFPSLELTIDKLASDVKMDESGRKHSFVLLDLTDSVEDVKRNTQEDVTAYSILDYTKKFKDEDEFGEWLCKKFQLFPTKKEYMDHLHRWWSTAGERDLIKKTEKKYDRCKEAIMDLASVIYNKILESK